jgi:hypothetical protein
MKSQYQAKPYAANLRDSFWQIVIPVSGKLSPLVWNADFKTKLHAESWIDSEDGQAFVAETRASRRLPAAKVDPPAVRENIETPDRTSM